MRKALTLLALFALAACSSQEPRQTEARGHIEARTVAASEAPELGNIPPPVTAATNLPSPDVDTSVDTHTVIVFDVPVRELLFSIARDSNLNLDIDPTIDQQISINAVDQPLHSLLERIASIAELRYEIDRGVLKIERDLPYFRNYQVEYLNIARTSLGTVSVSTQISAAGEGGDGGDNSTGNNSATEVTNVTENAFWDSLQTNISSLLNEATGDTGEAETEQTENNNVIVNREAGIIAVRATDRQHRDVQQFLDTVQLSTQRQVLIEATIAEVNLNDRFRAGIDWNLINPDGSSGVEILQSITDTSLSAPPAFTLTVDDQSFDGNALQATLRALETFGDVSVMSSPKVMAMNNQTALLKVVDNLVYFTVEVNIDTTGASASGGGTLTTFETEVNTVPVGFVMSVTPYINEANNVILNVRPTISRVISFARDPNPALAQTNVVSEIPVIQVREVESILRIDSGEIAIIGGLMQDETQHEKRGVPVLGRVPMLGNAFRYRDSQQSKTELVIFLKPTVINNASLAGDLKNFSKFLPASTR